MRCILFCSTRSSADSAMCRKRLTRSPVMPDSADASSSSRTARSYVSATALMEGLIIGWSTGSFTSSPNRYTLRSRFRRLSMYSSPVLIVLRTLAAIHRFGTLPYKYSIMM